MKEIERCKIKEIDKGFIEKTGCKTIKDLKVGETEFKVGV